MTNKTTPADRAALTATVEALAAELQLAQADVAMLRRLKDAERNAARIAETLTAAQDSLTVANADAALAARDDAFANFGDISIMSLAPANGKASVISTGFRITYQRMTYDMNTRQSTMQDHVVSGFHALPSDVFAYLMQVKPHAIPASIMALAPDDPCAAMDAYFMALRRGYLTTLAA